MYVTGLDLGLSQDATAVAVLEQTGVRDPDDPRRQTAHYAVRHLERFPPGTPYTDVSVRLGQMFAAPELADTTLVVDQTGVGRPVVEVLRDADIDAYICPVTITAGLFAGPDEHGGWLIPRKELVGTLQVLLQSRRIQVAPTLMEAATLVRELTMFRAKPVSMTGDPFEAWREGPHDDLVLAVAIAAWEGERHPPYDGDDAPGASGGRQCRFPWLQGWHTTGLFGHGGFRR